VSKTAAMFFGFAAFYAMIFFGAIVSHHSRLQANNDHTTRIVVCGWIVIE
jgi:hypothetical protein